LKEDNTKAGYHLQRAIAARHWTENKKDPKERWKNRWTETVEKINKSWKEWKTPKKENSQKKVNFKVQKKEYVYTLCEDKKEAKD